MLDPKEKAKEIICKMSVIHYVKLGGNNSKSKGLPVSMYKSQSIQCAINCVDEIISAFNFPKYDGNPDTEVNGDELFWNNVKDEILFLADA